MISAQIPGKQRGAVTALVPTVGTVFSFLFFCWLVLLRCCRCRRRVGVRWPLQQRPGDRGAAPVLFWLRSALCALRTGAGVTPDLAHLGPVTIPGEMMTCNVSLTRLPVCSPSVSLSFVPSVHRETGEPHGHVALVPPAASKNSEG